MAKQETQYYYGQEMLLINKHLIGRYPERAFIVSKFELSHIVMMSETFAFEHGKDPHFMMLVARLDKWWREAKKGKQTSLFDECKKETMRDKWRTQMIKTD